MIALFKKENDKNRGRKGFGWGSQSLLAKNKRKMIKIFGERVVDEDFNLCSQKQKKNDKNQGRKGCGWGSQSLFPKILFLKEKW